MKKLLNRKFFVVIFSLIIAAVASFALAACGKKTEAGPETGTYYYETAEGETYYVTLTGGDKVSMQIKGENLWGDYKLSDGTFAFTLGTDSKVEGSYADNAVTVVMDGSQMIFLRAINYTVTFDSNGGSIIASQKIMNGKSANKPADPVKAGYAFAGWYTDADYTSAYIFGVTPVTADTTLYARWSEGLTVSEVYTINFDLGYEGAEELAPVTTADGRAYGIANPSREGYTFGGWWISDFEQRSKLTAIYTDEYVFNADTTLFALWTNGSESVATPAPSVKGDSVVWDSVRGASTYAVEVVSVTSGQVLVSSQIGATNVDVPFSTSGAGEYKITVTAKTAGGEASETAVRYYNNKALARASRFEVIEPSALVFAPVEGAEKYTVTVICGNSEHNHSKADNGVSTYFDFSGCTMTENGIEFIVTASAAGKASSESRFVYKRSLEKIETLNFSAATETLYWNPVKNATDYKVTVNGATILTGGKTSVSLRSYSASTVKAEVTPVSEGYISPEAAVYTYERKQLHAPTGLKIVRSELSWNAVEGATSYLVLIDGQQYEAEGTSFDLSEAGLENGVDYEISVKAVGATQSVWSDEISAQYYTLSESVYYAKNTFSWKNVIGAASYNVRINGTVVSVESGVTSYAITFDGKGENELSVQFIGEDGTVSEWASINVYTYEIAFDAREGSPVAAMFVAAGDTVVLPESSREGYTLGGWYTVPAASAANGAKYDKEFVYNRVTDITLYAGWVPETYKLSYNLPEGATLDTEEGEAQYTRNYRLDVPTTEDTSKVFIGWYDQEGGRGNQLTDAEGYSLAAWDKMAGGNVYAYFASLFKFSLQEDGINKDTYSVVMEAGVFRVSKVVIPETYNGKKVSIIEGYAFRNCSTLRTIEIPDTIEIVYYTSAFERCSALTEIVVYETGHAAAPKYSSEDGVLYYESETAAQGKELVFIPAARTGNVSIPKGVRSIGESVFTGSRIETVTIPSTVSNISIKAFEDSKYLTDIYFDLDEGDELFVGDDAFSGCTALKSLTIPARYTTFSPEVLGDNASIENITVAEDHETYSSVSGLLCNKDGDTLIYCPAGRRGALRIPAGIRSIASGAFKNCANLTSVIIPSFVMRIEDKAFENCTRLTSVTFAGGNALGSKLSVGESVFLNCTSLSKVNFEENSNVVALGDGTFSGCSKITSIKLPATLQQISAKLFDGCTNLVTIEVDAKSEYLSAEDNILYNKDRTRMIYYSVSKTDSVLVLPESLETIDANLFKDNVTIEKVIFGKNVKEIGESAFENCANLMSIVFVDGGENELVIGDRAFASCSALMNIYVASSAQDSEDDYTEGTPANLRKIGAYAFTEAQFGGTVTLSEGLEEIGEGAFQSASFIMTVNLPATLKTIGNDAFGRIRMLMEVNFATDENGNIKSNLVSIGESAFNSTRISSFTVPASVREIKDDAFTSTSSLRSFTFEPRTETIKLGISVFGGSSLTSIVLPEGLCEVTYDTESRGYLRTTFDSASSLADIQNMPEHEKYAYEGGIFYEKNSEGVITIVDHAILNNYDFVVPNTVVLVRNSAFYGCTGSTLKFEAGGTEDLVLEDSVFYNSRITSVEFPARLKQLGTASPEQGMFYAAKTTSVTFVDTDAEPSRLTEIPAKMFEFSSGPNSFVVPRSVKKIGDEAFSPSWSGSGSNLKTLTLNEGLEEIGYRAFCNDSGMGVKITELVIPSTVKTIGDFAFAFAKQLTTITFARNAQGETSLEKLGMGAFMSSKISTITLPKTLAKGNTSPDWESVEEINGLSDGLFNGCTKLSEVIFEDGCPLITEYGNQVFGGCTSYANVTFPVNLEKMGSWGEGGAIKTIVLPNFVDADGLKDLVPSLTGVTSFSLEAGNNHLYQDGENGAIYNAERNILIYYPACYTQESYTVLPTTVTIGEQAFFENQYLKTIKLNEGLVKISDNAFGVSQEARTTALTGIEIPSTVTEIGKRAFFGAANLETLTFAKDEKGNCALERIGNAAFRHCSSLIEVELPFGLQVLGENEGWSDDDAEYNASVFYDCASLEKVTLPGNVMDLQSHVFAECPSLTTVIIPEGSAFARIAYYAFYNSGLTSIDFTNARGLVTIDTHAFDGCTDLAEIKFSDSTNNLEILEYAFADTAVKSLNLPASVIKIGDYAFKGVSALTNVNIAAGSILEEIGEYAFNGTSLTSFDFAAAESLKEIGAYAFAETGLTAVVLGDEVTKIGDYAFYGCENVAEFRLSEGIESIGTYAFAKLSLITAVKVAGNNTVIGENAFEDCSALKDVELESGVITVGNNAFAFTAITDIVLPDTVTSLSGNPFGGCPIESIEVKAEGADILFDEITKTLYNGDKTILYYQTTVTTGAFIVPESITSIMPGALAGSHITSITLPSQFTRIEDSTFRNCTELKSITIGKNITYIGASAFEGCTSLETITFERGGTQALRIADKAFKDCTSLKSLTIPHRLRDGGEEITKTRYIEYVDDYYDETFNCGGPGIGNNAFENTGIVTIDYETSAADGISDNGYRGKTLAIGDGAFRNCASLTSVTLPNFMANSDDFYKKEDIVKLPDVFTDEDMWDIESVTYNFIGNYAFYGCTKLVSVIMPEVTGSEADWGINEASNCIIGAHAFENCTSLTNFGYVKDGKYEWASYANIIQSYAFANTGLTEVILPLVEDPMDFFGDGKVKYSIDDYAFYGCKKLVTFEMHGNMSYLSDGGTPVLGKYAFKDCTALRTAIFDDMYAVMDGAFENCTALTKVEMTFRDSNIWTPLTDYRMVGVNAFKGCSSLTSVDLKGELETIEAGAFEGCTSLMNIVIPDDVTTVSATAFAGWKASQKITVPFKDADSVIGGYAKGWSANATVVYNG